MFNKISDGVFEVFRSANAYANDMVHPTVRLGVTGLARAGKTVFITSLVHNIIAGGRLPFFEAVARGRIKRAFLEPQPNDIIPRFDYEQHLGELTGTTDRNWPGSTSEISQLRLTLEYEPEGFIKKTLGHNTLHVDIVDYPGEWIIDLPLLSMSFRQWSKQAWEQSEEGSRIGIAKEWHDYIASINPADNSLEAVEIERQAIKASELFTDYLRSCRNEAYALSALPPGRFLMPGNMKGSPALTFTPLNLPATGKAPAGSLWAMMEKRYEAYKSHVIKPFFRNHFSQLDRQIVLVDLLSAINAGPDAVTDLQQALADILDCYRPGANNWLTSILSRKIDKILFAATKADHLHHTSHDRLQNILQYITREAIDRAEFAGADVNVLAMAAVRATRESETEFEGETIPVIMGTPLKGERIGDEVFDGIEEVGIFPGDLPKNPADIFKIDKGEQPGEEDLRFARFAPPPVGRNDLGDLAPIPYIRLDRAINFLIGDRLS